jgi:hypothetical protein
VDAKRETAITEACEELLGVAPDSIETPGGSTRESVRARFGGQSLIVTHRREEQRARLEALVLRTLSESSAAVPRLIAWRGNWLMQQDLGATRLSEALDQATDEGVSDLLNSALSSLIFAQRAGSERGLSQHLVRLGEKRPWFDKLFARRFAVGELLALPPPALPEDDLAELLRLREPRFIKWDARPGNALVDAAGKVSWIDWEHCGCRNALDDLVWLLADEYSPASETVEQALLASWLGPFSADLDAAEALEYFYCYGVFHSMVRLHYVLRYKGEKPWWDHARCLQLDKVGVTRESALRLTRRMRRWAAASVLLQPLVGWLEQVEENIPVT